MGFFIYKKEEDWNRELFGFFFLFSPTLNSVFVKNIGYFDHDLLRSMIVNYKLQNLA